MRYIGYLILFIGLTLVATPVFAQDTRYRVELLVLTHLDYDQEPREMKRLEDYSPATDFLTPPEEVDEEGETALEETEHAAQVEPGQEEPAVVDETVVFPEPEEPDPNAVVHVEEMSDVMQEAWRRLRLSAPFRPEQYLSWEQGSEEPFPALRVHDLEVVMVDDPYAELRLELLEQALEDADNEEQAIVFADAAGLETSGETGDEEPGLPDPTMYYRLDGAVTLKRTRFLHLDLDLQLREAIWDEDQPVVPAGESPEFEQPLPSAFMVHELQQSRQVKTGRMEYFDGPVLGVLAFITTIEIEEKEMP